MNEQEFEFQVDLGDKVVTETWLGVTWEAEAKRLLACKYPSGKVIAWRYPQVVVSTVLPRGC
jgi:hypothetical protein